ncbi:AbrB family transcriptional regulator [Dongia sp.]|jgi:membrane AbrB-like protein|uniref:AbrB family transcriptional regulator n=1 Tax=Dongia sp. TaxID=1977262 RepID=UPI0035AFC7CA
MDLPLSPSTRARILCLLLGAVGGGVFYLLHLPLPWMMGAMTFTTVAAVAGVRIALMPRVRMIFVAILGIMLGSAFTPQMLDHLQYWAISFLWLALYVVVTTYLVRLYYIRFAGYDDVTAYFAAAPGGLSEMIMAGSAFGGDEARISLAHGARILVAVFILSFGYRWLGGYTPASAITVTSSHPLEVADLLWLGGAGFLGFFGARLLKLPAYALVGPMIVSAGLHVAGITASRPPAELVAVAQIVVGSMIGARFTGLPLRLVVRGILLAIGATSLLLLVAVGFGVAVDVTANMPFGSALLAFSPGGLAEMSLIALALGIDAAYVSSHHVVRIFMIVVAAPLVFRLLRRKG